MIPAAFALAPSADPLQPTISKLHARNDTGSGGLSRLLSLSLPASAFDATGAGGKGIGTPINDGRSLLLKAQFTDGSAQLVRGLP